MSMSGARKRKASVPVRVLDINNQHTNGATILKNTETPPPTTPSTEFPLEHDPEEPLDFSMKTMEATSSKPSTETPEPSESGSLHIDLAPMAPVDNVSACINEVAKPDFKQVKKRRGKVSAGDTSAPPRKRRTKKEIEKANFHLKPLSENGADQLIRFTANDACSGTCDLLYKDHFHCSVPSCSAVFQNKNGVDEHFRLHELQGQMCPKFFHTTLARNICVFGAERNADLCSILEEHYHCLSNNCETIIKSSDPAFKRLEHCRMHTYYDNKTNAAQEISVQNPPIKEINEEITPDHEANGGHELLTPQKSNSNSIHSEGLDDESDQSLKNGKRRGRPPRRAERHPTVPHALFTSTGFENTIDVPDFLENGITQYKEYLGADSQVGRCPDEFCPFHDESKHWHCAFPRCYHASQEIDSLKSHIRDFHGATEIQEGYVFFDHGVKCRRPQCSLGGKLLRHFHCNQTYSCTYSFIRPSTQASHTVRVHGTNGDEFPPDQPFEPVHGLAAQLLEQIVGSQTPIQKQETQETELQRMVRLLVESRAENQTQNTISLPPNSPPPQKPKEHRTRVLKADTHVPDKPAERLGVNPVVKQLYNLDPNDQESASVMSDGEPILHEGNCGRPFCKQKKRPHYHCVQCGQAFQEIHKLENHLIKHVTGQAGTKRRTLPTSPQPILPKPEPIMTNGDTNELKDQSSNMPYLNLLKTFANQ